MSIHEIVLPETKPETEWVRGRALQKVSPTYDHARLQTLLGMAFTEWADAGERGRVGSEWRFRVTPPGQITRPLVPDVAFLSYAAFPADADRGALQVPLAAPTVAVEILSPDDRPADVTHKVETYLASGSELVVLVDPRERRFRLHDPDGVTHLYENDVFEHRALPGFRLDRGALFRRAAR